MRKAIKNKITNVLAYQLGAGSLMERQLIEAGKIRLLPSGDCELFSQESTTSGEIASAGDYFKVDGSGFPYPNKKEWFETRHRHLSGDQYTQIPEPLYIWQIPDGPCEEIDFLVKEGLLTLNPSDPKHYFNAFLWGAPLSAARDATVVFYEIIRDEQGRIVSASFNFCAAEEFERTYTVLE